MQDKDYILLGKIAANNFSFKKTLLWEEFTPDGFFCANMAKESISQLINTYQNAYNVDIIILKRLNNLLNNTPKQ